MPSPVRQFRARLSIHLLFLTPMVLILATGIWAAVSIPENSEGGWAVVGLIVVLLLIFYPLIWRIHLRLSPEGVLAAAPFCRLETTWDNVERFYQCGPRAGLVTRLPMEGKGPRRLLGSMNSVKPYDEQEVEWLSEYRYIPLRGFEHAVKSGAVEEAVQLWGQQAASPALPEPAREPVPKWIWFLIAGLIGLAVLVSYLPEHIEARTSSILQFIALLAATVSVFCRGILRWREGSRTLSVMTFILSLVFALLALAALGWMVEAWQQPAL